VQRMLATFVCPFLRWFFFLGRLGLGGHGFLPYVPSCRFFPGACTTPFVHAECFPACEAVFFSVSFPSHPIRLQSCVLYTSTLKFPSAAFVWPLLLLFFQRCFFPVCQSSLISSRLEPVFGLVNSLICFLSISVWFLLPLYSLPLPFALLLPGFSVCSFVTFYVSTIVFFFSFV